MKRFVIYLFCFVFFLSCTDVEEVPNTNWNGDALTKGSVQMCEEPISFVSMLESDSWRQVKSFEEKRLALAVPSTVAGSLTTKALLYSCLAYPLIYCYSAYNNEIDAIENVIQSSSLFQELLCRSDLAETILDFYETARVDPVFSKQKIGSSCDNLSLIQMHFLELLIASGKIPGLFEESNAARLLKSAQDHLKIREQHPDIYSSLSKKTAMLIIEEIESGAEVTIKNASRLLKVIEEQLSFKRITKASGDLLNEYIIYTPFGKSVLAYLREEMSPSEKLTLDGTYQVLHPNAIFIDSSSYLYNCHSYAWNKSISGPTLWIDRWIGNNYTDQLSYYWTNDAYVSTSSDFADVVLYVGNGVDHSAIPSFDEGRFISKFGYGPVMDHYPWDTPYNQASSYMYYRVQWYSQRVDMIDGEDIVNIGTPYVYVPSFIRWYNSSIVWEVSSNHENPTDFSYTVNGDSISVVYNVMGEFTIIMKYYMNGSLLATEYKPIVAY